MTTFYFPLDETAIGKISYTAKHGYIAYSGEVDQEVSLTVSDIYDEQNDLLATMMHDDPDQAMEILNNQSVKEYLEEKVQEAITDPENYLTDNVEESVPLVTDSDDATKTTIHYIRCISMGQNYDELETQIEQSKLLDAEQQKLLIDIIANWKTNQLKTVENFNQAQLDSFEDQMKQAENLLINEATAFKYYNHIISKQLK